MYSLVLSSVDVAEPLVALQHMRHNPPATPTHLRAPPACCCRWRRLLLPSCWHALRASLPRSDAAVSFMPSLQRCKRVPRGR